MSSTVMSTGSKSKYENLPGIAHDQPDVYETPDIPESDPYLDYQPYEEANPNIETPSISVEAAYEKFRLQKLHGIVNFDLCRGYRNDPVNPIPKETIAEKLARLKLEVEELSEEIKLTPPSEPFQINDLQELEKRLGLLVKSKNPDAILLQEKLEGFTEKPSGENPIQYELLLEKKLNASSTPLGQKAYELESRIQRLEQVLGSNKDALAPLGLQPNHRSVLSGITYLNGKLGLLEPAHLETIESRLASVLQKVTTILDKKMDVQELERNLKLSSLYDLLELSSSTIEALPELSERLDSLKDLHVAASGVIREIGAIKAIQEGIAAGFSENDKLLRELKVTLSSTLGNMPK